MQLPRSQLRHLLDDTAFSMANQDVRYYLNGLLFEVDNGTLRSVATDGHRLAMSSIELAADSWSFKTNDYPAQRCVGSDAFTHCR